jgi:YbbR domain-containing protein
MRRFSPFRNLGLKLLSLILAVLLWMIVAGEEPVERGLRVPLELQQFPSDLELLGEVPTTIDLRVRGGSATLNRMSASDVVAVLDLHSVRAGRRLFPLTAEQVRVPFGVQVVQVTPPTIAMEFENTATREVPVQPEVDGRPAPGYIVGKVTAEPAKVEIIGPASAVKRATEALTESVSVAGARAQVQQIASVGMLDPALRLKNPRGTTVTVQILPAPLERSLRDRPVYLRNLATSLSAAAVPDSVDIIVRGDREVLAGVDLDAVKAFVDLSGLGVGQYSLTVSADGSGEAGIARIVPNIVQVRITSAKN